MTKRIYRCRLTPQACPVGERPGYCVVHPTVELELEGVPAARRGDATLVAEDDTGPFGNSGDRTVNRGSTPDYPPREWELRLPGLDVAVPIPADGLEVGRDAPGFRALPGMHRLDQVGRSHARLYWVGEALWIVDNDSTNGTYVDGREITGPEPVYPGRVLRLAMDVPVEIVEREEDF